MRAMRGRDKEETKDEGTPRAEGHVRRGDGRDREE